jgi:hypothetical protein
LERFNKRQEDRPSSSNSTTSILSSSDWRKIQKLLKQAVNNIHQKESALLSQTFHKLTVQNKILVHENKALKEALVNKKKRRKRGKALLLEPLKDYHSRAVFWSPTKVQAAHDKQEEKDKEAKAEKAKKDKKSRLREEAKKEKAQVLEERKEIRAVAKELKLQEQRKKIAEREEKKTQKELKDQLKKDIQLSKKGKASVSRDKQPSSTLVKDLVIKIVEEAHSSRKQLSAATPARSWRARPIKLPKRLID